MKKEGFTLVELLAVIAILAILIILALPNILDIFNNSQKNSFKIEVQTIYRTAQQEFLINGGSSVSFYRSNGTACTTQGNPIESLALEGNTELDYFINIDSNGDITALYAKNDGYSFFYEGGAGSSGLNIEDIDDTVPVTVNADNSEALKEVETAIENACKAQS